MKLKSKWLFSRKDLLHTQFSSPRVTVSNLPFSKKKKKGIVFKGEQLRQKCVKQMLGYMFSL